AECWFAGHGRLDGLRGFAAARHDVRHGAQPGAAASDRAAALDAVHERRHQQHGCDVRVVPCEVGSDAHEFRAAQRARDYGRSGISRRSRCSHHGYGHGVHHDFEALMNGRARGFTLVELMVVVLLSSMIMASIYQMVVMQERTSRDRTAIIDTQQTARTGVTILSNELKEISAVDGDIVAATETSI